MKRRPGLDTHIFFLSFVYWKSNKSSVVYPPLCPLPFSSFALWRVVYLSFIERTVFFFCSLCCRNVFVCIKAPFGPMLMGPHSIRMEFGELTDHHFHPSAFFFFTSCLFFSSWDLFNSLLGCSFFSFNLPVIFRWMDAKAAVGKLDKLFMDFYIFFDYINILRCCITILASFSCENNG